MNKSYATFQEYRRAGFGVGLFRSSVNKSLGGVCGGISECFEVDKGLCKIAFILGLVFTGPVAIWVYIFLWVVLLPSSRSGSRVRDEAKSGSATNTERQFKQPVSVKLREANQKLGDVMARVERMEHYVTSKRFDLDKKFADLEK